MRSYRIILQTTEAVPAFEYIFDMASDQMAHSYTRKLLEQMGHAPWLYGAELFNEETLIATFRAQRIVKVSEVRS